MDINVTLLGEMLTFFVLVWVTIKYIWPPLIQVIHERQQKIAAGLAAAERSQYELELTQTHIIERLHQAKTQAAALLDQARQQASEIVVAGKVAAQAERTKILAQAQVELTQQLHSAKDALQQQTADLVITAVEKLLQQGIDDGVQKKLIDNLISSI